MIRNTLIRQNASDRRKNPLKDILRPLVILKTTKKTNRAWLRREKGRRLLRVRGQPLSR
jgi:hypothetical protein